MNLNYSTDSKTLLLGYRNDSNDAIHEGGVENQQHLLGATAIAIACLATVIACTVFICNCFNLPFNLRNREGNAVQTEDNVELTIRPRFSLESKSESYVEFHIPLKRLLVIKLLGKGQFGNVFEANLEGFNHGNVALKTLKDPDSVEDLQDFLSEIDTMIRMGKHEHVVNFLGCSGSKRPPYLVMELAENGNLRDFLRGKKETEQEGYASVEIDNNLGINIQSKIKFARQIASGMEFMASINCIHRDLAARNVLVTKELNVKISDFGFSKFLDNKDYYHKVNKGRFPIKWMAPESLLKSTYYKKSDVWSFGILLWEIMTLASKPYPQIDALQDLVNYLMEGNRMTQPQSCPYEIYLLMRRCWHYNVVERPTFLEVLQYFEDMKIEELSYLPKPPVI